ncbi:MAG: M55 family metallopeptidase [Candidatus Poribacteria bacterium]|nr:M55 family metallopeptidase [Candidatus Poribacteria bacterium]
MKIYILTDLEGAAMVSRFSQTREEGPSKQTAMKLLTWEVNAAVDGILDVDPDAEVVVWDGHGSGGLDVLEFHSEAKLITRGPIRPPYYLDETYDALFFVGQHAMAGTPNAPLSHTYSSRSVEYYKLNGMRIGEFGCRAVMAGSFDVPTVFISGDDKAVAEAKELVPKIYSVETKQGLGQELALHLSPQKSREAIRKTAAEACRHIDQIQPLKIDPPYEQEIRALEGQSIEGYLRRGAVKIDDRTVVKRSDTICELFI